jgi:hypothetical protein
MLFQIVSEDLIHVLYRRAWGLAVENRHGLHIFRRYQIIECSDMLPHFDVDASVDAT